MSDRHPGKFSKTGGKCLTVILANFQKQEENVLLSSWQIFKNGRKMSDPHPVKLSKNGRKMSDRHPGKFSKTGGKCPTVILANFQKREENIRLSSWQIFKNGRKMSDFYPGKSSIKGGKCPTVILTDFQKREENVRLSSLQIFKNGRKMSDCHHCKFSNFFDQFSKIGGRCLYVRFDNFSQLSRVGRK